MKTALPTIVLVRHGETAWSVSGQHTGRTDIPLTERGREEARRLGDRLAGRRFGLILTGPQQRAAQTGSLAGFGAVARVDPDLAEWDYGDYEGRTTAEILRERPGWRLFRDGCPAGESADQVGSRADRVIARSRATADNVLLISSAHILRVLAARWIGLEASAGRALLMGTAAVGVLGYEHDRDEPTIHLWNDRHQVESEPIGGGEALGDGSGLVVR